MHSAKLISFFLFFPGKDTATAALVVAAVVTAVVVTGTAVVVETSSTWWSGGCFLGTAVPIQVGKPMKKARRHLETLVRVFRCV